MQNAVRDARLIKLIVNGAARLVELDALSASAN